ncbi:MAG: acetate/propionate family kinase [Acidiferrobacteraceae bacterium]
MRILTLNSGSSSLKAALYRMDAGEERLLSAGVERIGVAGSRMRMEDAGGDTLLDQEAALTDHDAALRALFDGLRHHGFDRDLTAIGFRIVYGGSRFSTPQRVTPDLVTALREMTPLDPDHLPQACASLETTGRRYPDLPRVACFDTAFHRHMPRVAQHYALPRRFTEAGIQRFGFHGLSYESIVQALRVLDPAAVEGRVVIAHLGSGASMAAVRGGLSIDTSMGFTPLSGLMMGTRCGDLDPGIVLYLLQAQGMSPAAVNELLNRQSGLLGVSEVSADMRDLLGCEGTDPRAAEAIARFCYQARKYIGAYAAALGGLDTLVFTAGIGERAATIRARICSGIEYLGVLLDEARNAGHAPVISRDGAPVTVRVIATDEDLMIARHTRCLIEPKEGADHVDL